MYWYDDSILHLQQKPMIDNSKPKDDYETI